MPNIGMKQNQSKVTAVHAVNSAVMNSLTKTV